MTLRSVIGDFLPLLIAVSVRIKNDPSITFEPFQPTSAKVRFSAASEPHKIRKHAFADRSDYGRLFGFNDYDENAKVAYLTSDHFGSPRINTDRDGNVTARHDYHRFGEEIYTAHRTTGLGYEADIIRRKFTTYDRV